MSEEQWYYAEMGASKGPISRPELDGLYAAGTVQDTTLVWTEGMADWAAFGTLNGEVAAKEAPPPRSEPLRHFGFVASVQDGIRRFFDFEGRSNRPQFWYFQLALLIGGFLTGLLDQGIGMGGDGFSPLNTVFQIVAFLPSISVSIRRLHDIGRPGWWLFLVLIPIIGWLVLLYFYVQPSEARNNHWGIQI